TNIITIKPDHLVRGNPFIPKEPRKYHALAYITDGSLRYTRDGQTVELTQHEILFVRSGSVDIAECASGQMVQYITLDFDTLDDEFTSLTRFSPGERAAALFESFSRMLQCFRTRGFNWKMECIEMLYGILNELRRSTDEQVYKYRRIAPAMAMLEERLTDPSLSASVLADACGIGTGSLSRIQRELYGTTTNRLIWMRRMETACDLLRSSPLNIGEIAARCGYANIYTFSHAFRRAFGVPPTDWRG
ncbi:MAG: helix-turn-helix transcriptional regulator, partial [Clostridia bacterium]|nr:helix-turn-helix transcriptional regulator [Clostridia bacterium]